MNTRKQFGVAVSAGVVFAAITAVLLENVIFAPARGLQIALFLKIFFTSFNIIILSALLANYVRIHMDMPTPMTRTLMIFSGALLLYALSSSPLLHVMFGFEVLTIGPFTFLPDVFASAASLAILYESYR